MSTPNELDEIRTFLPLDYTSLTEEGKRQARVAIASDSSSPSSFIRSWKFFRQVYLLGSGIFYKQYVPSPAYHSMMVGDFFQYPLNVEGAPRGGGKSTVMAEEIPLLCLVTQPGVSFAICTATQSLVEDRLDHIMLQLAENTHIIEDFGVLKTKRGEGMWSRKSMRLTNHSFIRGFPVEGRKRGARPDVFILDDPEYDAKNPTASERLRVEFDRMLFRQIFPMLREGCRLFWVGTLIDRRSYIFHAISTKDDKRFQAWNRRVIGAEIEEKGHIHSIWPEMWSVKYLQRRRLEMGSAAYSAEYLNKPISSEECVLKIDEVLDTYSVQGEYLTKPWTSSATITYTHIDPRTLESIPKEEPIGSLLRRLYIVILVDYAQTIAQYSDFSAVHVMGFDNTDTLWSLDLWAGKVRSGPLVDIIYKMGHIWRPRVVGVEAVSVQYEIFERVKARFEQGSWQPRVFPVRYPFGVTKTDRMGSLEWRFSCHRIKYPRHIHTPPYKMLWDQTRNYTTDLALLEHDDCLDTIAMTPYLVRGRGKVGIQKAMEQNRILDRASGFNPLEALNSTELTPQEVDILLDKEYDRWYGDNEKEIRPLSEVRTIE